MVIDDEPFLVECEERAAMARSCLDDEAMCRSYAERAANADVPRLVGYIRQLLATSGGDLGTMIREAVKSRVMRSDVLAPHDAKQTAAFHPDVVLHSLTISVISTGSVVVDARLLIGGKGQA
jgi:hypothetical protein